MSILSEDENPQIEWSQIFDERAISLPHMACYSGFIGIKERIFHNFAIPRTESACPNWQTVKTWWEYKRQFIIM